MVCVFNGMVYYVKCPFWKCCEEGREIGSEPQLCFGRVLKEVLFLCFSFGSVRVLLALLVLCIHYIIIVRCIILVCGCPFFEP